MVLVLGAALGAHTTQVEVRDADTGALVATGSTRHADLDPDVDDPTTWWRSLANAVAQTRQREIAAISVCGSHPGLVLLDGAGAVLRPMQPWADAEAATHAARLRSTLGADRWAEQAGILPTPATAVSRLAWLRRSDPDTFSRIGAALLPHDWLTYRLAGRIVTDRGGASLTGAWSPATEAWIPEVLEELAPGGARQWWAERLPTVLGPSERADWLDAPVFELLGLRGRPLVGPGTGEAMAVALALGLLPGKVGISLGPTATVLTGLSRPVVDPSGAVRSHADATGRHLAVATAGDGAALIDAVRTLLGIDPTELAALASLDAASPGGDRLVLVPEVPGRDGAVLAGLSADTGRGDLARATFEGVACSALDALDLVLAAGGTWLDDEPLRLAAPADVIDVLAQLLADLSGRPVRSAPTASLAAAGACIQAAAVAAHEAPEDIAAAWDLGHDHWDEPVDDVDGAARRQAHTIEHARQRQALTRRR
ncbi:MAG: FGGY family carbohydrate kinase [Acidimicrobiales bacterium]